MKESYVSDIIKKSLMEKWMLELGLGGQIITSLSGKERVKHRMGGRKTCTSTRDISYQEVDSIERGVTIEAANKGKAY